MTRRDADRVANLVASAALHRCLISGQLFEVDDISDADITKIMSACERLSDRLFWRGFREDYPPGLVSLMDCLRAAGVALPAAPRNKEAR